MYSSSLVRFAAIRFVVAGNTIVSKAEQHVRIKEVSLVQLQQQPGQPYRLPPIQRYCSLA
jgi:hypothetical protein